MQAMVVNDEFIRIFLNDIDPIGFQFPGILTRDVRAEIVGVVGNVLKDGPDATPQPEVYVAISPKFALRNELNLVVRTAGDPSELGPPIRRVLRDVRPDGAIDAVATLESQLSESVAQPRFAAVVVAGLATLALVLSAVGLYGALA
jgi:hypothetical protein